MASLQIDKGRVTLAADWTLLTIVPSVEDALGDDVNHCRGQFHEYNVCV